MKLSKLQTIINAVDDILEDDVLVMITEGRDGNIQHTNAKAKFTLDADGYTFLQITKDY